MEASTPTTSTVRQTTGSRTIADLLPRAAELHGDRVAVRHKSGGEWHDVTFAQVWASAREIGLGLIDLGIQPGDRVAILANTRVEWTLCDFGVVSAAAVAVPIYPTNSPEECAYVLADSGAVAVFCEDATQAAKIAAVRDRVPELRTVIVMAPDDTVAGDAVTLDELRERGRWHDASELEARYGAVGPDDPLTFIYTSGTTGPPKGCVLAHGNYRRVLDMLLERRAIGEEDDLIYLFLPLAHAYALLIQLAAVDLGTPIAYWGRDTKQIIAELSEVHPTYLPSVPRIFEKIYTLVSANVEASV